jgi:hypothetical protein
MAHDKPPSRMVRLTARSVPAVRLGKQTTTERGQTSTTGKKGCVI